MVNVRGVLTQTTMLLSHQKVLILQGDHANPTPLNMLTWQT